MLSIFKVSKDKFQSFRYELNCSLCLACISLFENKNYLNKILIFSNSFNASGIYLIKLSTHFCLFVLTS